jgi:hypothetical protein
MAFLHSVASLVIRPYFSGRHKSDTDHSLAVANLSMDAPQAPAQPDHTGRFYRKELDSTLRLLCFHRYRLKPWPSLHTVCYRQIFQIQH